MKTQILMDENNIDWTAVFQDREEKSIFEILKQNKTQVIKTNLPDNGLQKFSLDDFELSELQEIQLLVTVKIDEEFEKQTYDFIKSDDHWGVIRSYIGETLPIKIEFNQADSDSSGFFSIDIVGTGAGAKTAQVSIFARSKLTS